MRCFLAIALDDATRHALAAEVDGVLRATEGGRMPGRAVPVPNWHVTMRFLGAIDQLTSEKLLSHLADVPLGAPFPVRFAGFGAFPHAARATVLWIGVDDDRHELTRLAETVEDAVVASGVSPEDRPFHPHVTVSRIRPPRDVTRLVTAPTVGVTMRIDRLTLYRSHLDPGGARYEILDEVPLGG